MKTYQLNNNIGKARYVVSFNDGEKTHKDGSPFFDIKIFSNKKELKKFVSTLTENGYSKF